MFDLYYFHLRGDIFHSSRLPSCLSTLPESIFLKVFLVLYFCFWRSRICFYAVLVTLQWVFRKVCSRCLLFDPSLVPHWGRQPWFIYMTTNAAWILTSSFHFCLRNCVFRFPPTSIFIVTPSVDRLPTKAKDPFLVIRHLGK